MIRGATVMRGYWEKPEATAKKLKPGPLPGELVLYTGDYCRLDDEGYLYFVGRMDDIIKSRGEKVAPKEVENVLYNIKGVRDAAVIGVPDEILGQAVKAFVVLEQGVVFTDEGHPARVPGQARELHGAEVRRDRRRSAEDDDRKDQEDGFEVSDDAELRRRPARPLTPSTSAVVSPPDDRRFSASTCCAAKARSCRVRRPSCSAGPRSASCRRPAIAAAGHRHVLRRRQPRLRRLPCMRLARGSGRAISPTAASAGRSRNVEHLGLGDRVEVCQGDLFAGLADQGLEGTIDIVVCNPPYISSGRLAGDRAELLEHEPREAFDGGPYGLSIHQRVMADAPRFLKPGGWLLMEFGLGQHRQVKILLDRTQAVRERSNLSNDAARQSSRRRRAASRR